MSSKQRGHTDSTSKGSALDSLYQQGSARIRFPHAGPDALQAVLLNTAGGLTGDDHMHWEVEAGDHSTLITTTAACEKVYRTHGPAAQQMTHAKAGVNAQLFWLPQETIVFNGAALNRQLTAQIDTTAQALFVESLILGRQAMNETIEALHIHDQWRLYRGDKLLHAEELKLSFDDNFDAQKTGILHHHSAITTIVFVSPLSSEALNHKADTLRSLIPTSTHDVLAAVSVMEHRIVMRMLSIDSFQMRKILIPCVEFLSDGAPVPTVWTV